MSCCNYNFESFGDYGFNDHNHYRDFWHIKAYFEFSIESIQHVDDSLLSMIGTMGIQLSLRINIFLSHGHKEYKLQTLSLSNAHTSCVSVEECVEHIIYLFKTKQYNIESDIINEYYKHGYINLSREEISKLPVFLEIDGLTQEAQSIIIRIITIDGGLKLESLKL